MKGNQYFAHHDEIQLFHDGGPYYIKTSPLICSENQWTGFYMIETSVMKELRKDCILNIDNYDVMSSGEKDLRYKLCDETYEVSKLTATYNYDSQKIKTVLA